MNLYQKQLELEMEMHGSGVMRFEKANQRNLEAGQASETDWFRRLTREFVKPMSDSIQAYIEYYTNRSGKPSPCIKYLNMLPTESAGYITIKCVLNSMNKGYIEARDLVLGIGRSLEDEVRFTKLSEASPKYIEVIRDSLKKRASKSSKFEHDALVHAEKELVLLNHFQKLVNGGVDKAKIMELLKIQEDKYSQLLKKADYAVDVDRWVKWPDSDVILLGSTLLEIFNESMQIDGQPLIVKRNRLETGRSKMKAEIVATDALNEWVEQYKEVMKGMTPNFSPCVVPPRDWTSPTDGGFHTREVSSKLTLVKTRDKKHLKRLTKEQMPAIYKAVNYLQSCKWQVNKGILSVAREIQARSLPLGMPSTEKLEAPLCPVPEQFQDLRGEMLKKALTEKQYQEFTKWKRDRAMFYSSELKRGGSIREVSATLSMANKYAEFDNIYFVYALDFRSRFNVQSTYLTPQGGDLQKALLRPSEAIPLGEEGEYWFKVQGANVWGYDKEEFDDRVSLVSTDEFKDMCLDIAADPASFVDWVNADKPWQFLSWCFEYASFLEWCEDNDPKDYKTRVIVAMDGSCSGIQHYSAMLRDEIGGKEVNLVPSDKPQDIYKAVAEVALGHMESILDNRERDLPMWDKIDDKFGYVKCVKLSEGWTKTGVSRGLAKKPVMTMPYGSSVRTCYESVQDYLSEVEEKERKKALALGVEFKNTTEFDKGLTYKEITSFASSMIWDSIGEVVVAARAGMKYIKGITNELSKRNQYLEWTTPTGFIVKQCIFNIESDRVKTKLMGGTVFHSYKETKEIYAARMASSAAPNFIHSMDASHLTFAVNAYEDEAIPFMAVIHDSFGTYPSLTKLGRNLLRNTFVDMYQEYDVIKLFKEENEERLGVEFKTEEPARGSLDLEIVRESEYLFG